MATYTYINYALYYKLDDSEKDKCVEGFGQTLSQTGHLCSSIEQDHDGDHLLVRKKRGTRSSCTFSVLTHPGMQTSIPYSKKWKISTLLP